jgi:hypothetical protein
MRNAILILFVLAAATAATAAQATQQPPTKREVEEAVARTREIQQKVEATPSAMATTNVQVELTITDQTGSAPPEKKTVSMIVANAAWGKIRTSAEAYQKSTQSKIVPVGLNVDARPWIHGGQVRLELTIIYSPMMLGTSVDSAQTRPTELNQSLTVALQSGKPMVVSQAADPVTDRKIGVEVKATILK